MSLLHCHCLGGSRWVHIATWMLSMCEKTKGHKNQSERSENCSDSWNWSCVPPFAGEATLSIVWAVLYNGDDISRLVSGLPDSCHGEQVFCVDVYIFVVPCF